MSNDPLRELRQLKDVQASPESLDGGRIRLMAFMASHPMLHPELAMPWWRRALVWKPAVAVGLAASLVSGAGAVYAAGSSQPGGRLYGVKLLTEEVRTRLAFSPESRFRSIARQAELRLDEAEQAMRLEDQPNEVREEHVRLAMANYQTHVAAMAALATNFEKDDSSPRAAEAVKTVEQVLARHEKLVDSTSSTSDEVAEASVVMPMQHALDLEDHVMKALSAQAKIQKRVQERADRMRKRWQLFEKDHHTAETVKQADQAEAHEEEEHDSHEHPEQDGPTTTPPPAARVKIRAHAEAGQSANINTNDVENAVNGIR